VSEFPVGFVVGDKLTAVTSICNWTPATQLREPISKIPFRVGYGKLYHIVNGQKHARRNPVKGAEIPEYRAYTVHSGVANFVRIDSRGYVNDEEREKTYWDAVPLVRKLFQIYPRSCGVMCALSGYYPDCEDAVFTRREDFREFVYYVDGILRNFMTMLCDEWEDYILVDNDLPSMLIDMAFSLTIGQKAISNMLRLGYSVLLSGGCIECLYSQYLSSSYAEGLDITQCMVTVDGWTWLRSDPLRAQQTLLCKNEPPPANEEYDMYGFNMTKSMTDYTPVKHYPMYDHDVIAAVSNTSLPVMAQYPREQDNTHITFKMWYDRPYEAWGTLSTYSPQARQREGVLFRYMADLCVASLRRTMGQPQNFQKFHVSLPSFIYDHPDNYSANIIDDWLAYLNMRSCLPPIFELFLFDIFAVYYGVQEKHLGLMDHVAPLISTVFKDFGCLIYWDEERALLREALSSLCSGTPLISSTTALLRKDFGISSSSAEVVCTPILKDFDEKRIFMYSDGKRKYSLANPASLLTKLKTKKRGAVVSPFLSKSPLRNNTVNSIIMT
jgi:hypothetical protein